MSGHDRETRELPPLQKLESLDELWFQVGGTLCNLSCNHCFISCHPGNDTFGFLGIETVRKYLRESEKLGVREYYFTGGEPFLNRDMLRILEETLAIGPATVLTNGTVFTPASIKTLREISQDSPYSLELRVSIDGYNPQTNDPIRGEGTFEQAMAGVRMLVEAGFLPIITIAQEGGRVSRIRLIGNEPPNAQALREKGDRKLIKRHGQLTGQLPGRVAPHAVCHQVETDVGRQRVAILVGLAAQPDVCQR